MPKKDGLALAASLRRRYPGLVIWGVTAARCRSRGRRVWPAA